MISSFLITAAIAAYTHWLPGLREWCWAPASGPVVEYEVEAQIPLRGFAESFTTTETCAEILHDRAGVWNVRTRAIDEDGTTGPWSVPSDDYRVLGPIDSNGDDYIGVPDLNALRDVFGLCLDDVGYGECE